MKRGWLVLLEMGVSIVLMTISFLYLQSHVKTKESFLYFDPELYRNLTADCSKHPNLIYYFNNSTTTVYCAHGKNVNSIKGFQLVGQYFYAGYKNYNPKVIAIYQ